jgi:ATP-dependent DNA ligase
MPAVTIADLIRDSRLLWVYDGYRVQAHLEGGRARRPVRATEATWVRPELFAAIQYRAITSDGLLRHASLKGLHRSAGAPRRSKPRAR